MPDQPIQLGAPIPEAIAAGADRFLRGFLERKQQALQQQQIDLESKRVDLEGGKLGLEMGKFQSDQRARAFDKAITMTRFMQPGQTLRDMPALLPIFKEALPEFSDDDFMSFVDIPINSKTVQSVIADQTIRFLEDPNLDPTIRERFINREILGTPVSKKELAVQGKKTDLEGKQTDIISEGLDIAMGDPEFIKNSARIAMGQSPTFTIDAIPGVTFSNDTAANITKDLIIARDRFTLEMGKIGDDAKTDLVKEIVQLGKDMEIGVGRPFAINLIDAYEKSARGNYKPGESPIELLYNRSTDSDKRVIQAFTGTAEYGQDAWLHAQSQPFQDFVLMGRNFAGIMDKSETTGEMRNAIKQGVVNSLSLEGGIGPWGKKFSFQQAPAAKAGAAPPGNPAQQQALLGLGQAISQYGLAAVMEQAATKGIQITPEQAQRAQELFEQSQGAPPQTIPTAPLGERTIPQGGPREGASVRVSGEQPSFPALQPQPPAPDTGDTLTDTLTRRISEAQSELAQVEASITSAEEQLKTPSKLPGRSPGQPHPAVALRRQLVENRKRRGELQKQVKTYENVIKRRGATSGAPR